MIDSTANPWKRIDSRIVYETKWLRVREDQVIGPDGAPTTYSVVELPRSVAVVVVNDRDQVALVGQWRYAHQRFSWEIPTGGCDDDAEAPLEAAKREVREEIGVTASQWQPLGTIDNSNGSTTDTAHMFLARDLTRVGTDPDLGETLSLQWVTFGRALAMVEAGEITESGSVVALLQVDRLMRLPTRT